MAVRAGCPVCDTHIPVISTTWRLQTLAAPSLPARDLAIFICRARCLRIEGWTHDGKMEMARDITPPTGDTTRTRFGTGKVPEEMFQGLMDDVRIYARPLSDAEVMMLKNVP
jgi:hypothetical protein